jgi:hypothetical protein
MVSRSETDIGKEASVTVAETSLGERITVMDTWIAVMGRPTFGALKW